MRYGELSLKEKRYILQFAGREVVLADDLREMESRPEFTEIKSWGLEFVAAYLPESEELLNSSYKGYGKQLSELLNLPLDFVSEPIFSEVQLQEAKERSSWEFAYYDYPRGKDEYAQEALLTTGNGFIGLRGTTPEMTISDDCYPATYVAGLYNETVSQVGDQKVVNEDFVNAPNCQYLTIAVDDEVISLTADQLLELQRRLSLKTGLFEAEAVVETASGKRLRLTTMKFVSMAERGCYGIRYQVQPLNFSGEIQLISEADGGVYNYNVARYRSLNQQHVKVEELQADGGQARLVARTTCSDLKITQESRLHSSQVLKWQNEILGKKIRQTAVVKAVLQQPVTVEKLVFVDLAKPSAETVAGMAKLTSFAELLQASIEQWEQLWQEADIQIKGDHMSEKLLRLHNYHLLISASPLAAPELDVSVTARGLHGEAYRGHIFWDELFILPFYIMHFPETAKALLMYRYHRLAAATQAAGEIGCEGAMYPWQSGLDGSEQSQKLHLNPISGDWDEDHSRLQRHVSLAIAYNLWLYFENTGDEQFLTAVGLEMLLEIAKFWISSAAYDEGTQRYHIAGVMGPDEFHESYPGSQQGGLQDNAYTNMMVVWLFEEIQKLLALLPPEAVAEVCKKTHFTAGHSLRMTEIMHQLTLEINPEGIIAQFAGYFNLQELDWDYYREQYDNIHRMDRILRAEGRSADEYQVAKQADSLMIFYNFEKQRIDQILQDLNYQLPSDYLEKNLAYYLARTSHGSTLSRVVHAQLAAVVEQPELSWQLYQEALYSDYQDIQGGTTAEGIHAGVMAATVYTTLTTYGGVDIRQQLLQLDPQLPADWQLLRFQLVRRGVRYRITVEPQLLTIIADHDTAVRIEGQLVNLLQNQTKKIQLGRAVS